MDYPEIHVIILILIEIFICYTANLYGQKQALSLITESISHIPQRSAWFMSSIWFGVLMVKY